MLLQLRDYIVREGVVSTQQLSREFRLDLPALQPMLDLWVRKKVIACVEKKGDCQSTCFKCKTQAIEYYMAYPLPI